LIFLSRSEQHPAEVLFQEFESLQSSVKLNMRRHHLDTCLVAHASATSQQEGGSNPLETTASDDAQDAAAYFQYFSSGLEKAFKKGRLPPGFKVVPREERPSCKHIALQKKSAWCRAQADVYFFIGQFLAQQEQVEDAHVFKSFCFSFGRDIFWLRIKLPDIEIFVHVARSQEFTTLFADLGVSAGFWSRCIFFGLAPLSRFYSYLSGFSEHGGRHFAVRRQGQTLSPWNSPYLHNLVNFVPLQT